ncbi:MAG TPA: hypothetical protein VF691_21235 [Cytophagaceae bacterium]|jgi:hypothetical protein
MKVVEIEKLDREISRMAITPFNYHNSFNDKIWFQELVEFLFKEEDKIMILGLRENDFYLDQSEIISLRKEVPELIKNIGGAIHFSQVLDNRRFNLVLTVKYFPALSNSLFTFWKYFEFFKFFTINGIEEDIKAIINDEKDYFSYLGLRKILNSNISKFLIGKTLEDNELCIDYRNDYEINKLFQFTSR